MRRVITLMGTKNRIGEMKTLSENLGHKLTVAIVQVLIGH